MKERNVAIALFALFIFLGVLTFCLTVFITDFNFYKSHLEINEFTVNEKLYFHTDKPYHTLYRNFLDPLYPPQINSKNFISLVDITCSGGQPYLRDRSNNCYNVPGFYNVNCQAFTEKNEYGCTFGSALGFKKNSEYTIDASYIINPQNIFKIKNRHYIKFIVYSKDNHKLLTKNNFLTSKNIIRKNNYLPNEDVIVYIPYEGNTQGLKLIVQNSFDFNTGSMSLLLFMCLFPAILFILVWFIEGREYSCLDIPEELSDFPSKIKGWEVATFYNPPFSIADDHFISSIMLDFYHKKILDIKVDEKNLPWVKIYKDNKKISTLDDIELKFLSILQSLNDKCSQDYIDGEYFNIKKASYRYSLSLKSEFKILQKELKKKSKMYLSSGPKWIPIIFALVSWFLIKMFNHYYLAIFYFISLIMFSVILNKSALLNRFRGEYYIEYQKWQAFKKYLSKSFSITKHGHQAVKLWDHYLIYGAALGVSKKVIKELRSARIIDEKDYNIYTGINLASVSFASSSGSKGGSLGGASGGGIGGGGGGGR